MTDPNWKDVLRYDGRYPEPPYGEDEDDREYDESAELPCMDCGGDGYVDSVSEVSRRFGWDDDGPGNCPNCGGSGLRKDQKTF